MGLSEAMRIGAMLRPQAYGDFRKKIRTGFLGLFGKSEYATCALGAAVEAGNIPSILRQVDDNSAAPFRGGKSRAGTTVEEVQFPQEWLDTIRVVAACPVCGKPQRLAQQIPHLNDKHRWTRERIADFVALYEPRADDLQRQGLETEYTYSGGKPY
jgi:hypothetical protein